MPTRECRDAFAVGVSLWEFCVDGLDPTDANKSEMRFFKVEVELK